MQGVRCGFPAELSIKQQTSSSQMQVVMKKKKQTETPSKEADLSKEGQVEIQMEELSKMSASQPGQPHSCQSMSSRESVPENELIGCS